MIALVLARTAERAKDARAMDATMMKQGDVVWGVLSRRTCRITDDIEARQWVFRPSYEPRRSLVLMTEVEEEVSKESRQIIRDEGFP